MTTLRLTACFVAGAAALVAAQETAWNATAIKECDRACLVGILDRYMNAIFTHDPKAVPALAADVRMTENTGQMDVGEGLLWRSKVEPTTFKIHHVEAAPFVTIPYGLGNGWTPGSGR